MGARHDYVHGYSGRERERLADQANTLAELLHSDTFYPSGSVVLEVGCGVDAQTVTLSQMLKPGGTITVIEGDHGSTYFHPESPNARKGIRDLYRTAEADGTFCYTFFKAVARAGGGCE